MLITKYKFNNTLYNLFPEFNSEFGFTYTDEVNGNITTRTIESDSSPTMIRFGRLWVAGEGATSNRTNSLLEVLDMNVNSTDCSSAFRHCRNVTSINLSNFNTSGATRMDSMFNGCSSLTSLDLSGFNTSAVYDMNNMFLNCSRLTSLNLSGFNIMNSEMSYMFQNCTNLISVIIHNLNSSSINKIIGFLPTRVGSSYGTISISYGVDSLSGITTNASSKNWNIMINKKIAIYTFNSSTDTLPIFNNGFTYSYTDVNNGDGTITRTITSETSPITSETSPSSISFDGKTGLVSLSYLDISNVTDMYCMFYECTNLTTLDTSNWDTSNVTNMSQMFSYCTNLTSLDLSNFDTSNVTNMEYMFSYCASLISLDISSFDTSNVTNMSQMFNWCNKLTTLDVSNFDTRKVEDMSYMFRDCANLTSLDVSNFDTSNVEDMGSMFYNCQSLTSLDVSNWDTGKVTNISHMFYDCTKLTTLNLSNWDTGNVTDTSWMFRNCSSLTTLDLSNWDTSKVTNMENMFYICNNLNLINMKNSNVNSINKIINVLPTRTVDAPGTLKTGVILASSVNTVTANSKYWNIVNDINIAIYTFNSNTDTLPTFNNGFTYSYTDVNNGDGTITRTIVGDVLPSSIKFGHKKGLVSLSYLDTSDVTDMSYMFNWCTNLTSLDVSSFSTSNATNMYGMFEECTNLTTLDLSSFNTSKVTTMYGMFRNCNKLTTLDVSNFETGKVTDMNSMFYNCKTLTLLDISSFDTSKVTNMDSMFSDCNNLIKIKMKNNNIETINKIIDVLPTRTEYGVVNLMGNKKVSGTNYNIAKEKYWKVYYRDSDRPFTIKMGNTNMKLKNISRH